ncbi:MAG: ParA family protein [Okeania sp. SIO2F4]|uniref:ParA family protein n=1 Tax=Okeania sp. SIO2F4 TaxID=2607790 RepID=UPI001429E156|nr:ParA family protein [Okeania sp. SIO2F4]NES05547.1 ParA family protein [Okeania sp. SIO2F4]
MQRHFIYDYVLIDLPPSFNNLVTAALYSSNYLIIPCTSDTFCSYCVGLIGETLPRFINEWQLGCQRYNTYNPHDERYNDLGKPVFIGWIFNGYDTRKPKNEQNKQTIAADKKMESKISESVKKLLESLGKITVYTAVPKKYESVNFRLGGIEDMNVLIQNSMWQNCPIAKLSEFRPVRDLQNRASWSPQQTDLIKELTNAFESIAYKIIDYCK